MLLPDLFKMIPKFKGNVYDNWLQTKEGVKAVIEAIAFLKK